MTILLLRMLGRDCPGATLRECCCQHTVSSSHNAPSSAGRTEAPKRRAASETASLWA